MEISDIKWRYEIRCVVTCDCGGDEFYNWMVENYYGTFIPLDHKHICSDCGKKFVYENIELPQFDSSKIRIKAVK